MRDEKEGLSSSLIPLPSSLALLRKSALWLLMVSLPVAVLTSALAPLAIHLVFGPRYAAAAPVLAIGIWRVPATGLSLLTGYSLLAVKRQDLELRTGAAGTVISLALVVLLVHYYGALGGAIAVATRPLVAFLLRLPYLRRHVSCFWPWKQMAQLVVALFLMAIPLAFVRSSHLSVRHAALVLAAAGIYAISLAAMRVDPMPTVVQRVQRWLRRLAASFFNQGSTPRDTPPDPPREPVLAMPLETPLAVTTADHPQAGTRANRHS